MIQHLPCFGIALKKDKNDFSLQFFAKRLVRKVIIVAQQIFQLFLDALVWVLSGRWKKTSEEHLHAFEDRKICLYLFCLDVCEFAINLGEAFGQKMIEIAARKCYTFNVLRNLLSASFILCSFLHHIHDVE